MPSSTEEVSDGTFRILALDGGGIKGTFTAAILARWEEATKQRICEHFDLIAGTSTGGILALALGLGLDADDVLKFYREHGPTIFPNTSFRKRLGLSLGHLTRPKYSQEVLRTALTAVFQDKKLGDSRCRLLIPTYDAVNGRIYLLKTAHHEQFDRDYKIPAVTAALATAAAPTFFDTSAIPELGGMKAVDGGVWANCPALAAVVEAHHFLKVPLDTMEVLSVGTTQEPPQLLHKLDRGLLRWFKPGIFRWAPHLLGLLFEGQMESSRAIASLLVGKERFLRVNRMVPQKWFSLDSVGRIEDMVAVGDGLASEIDVLTRVKTRFLNGTPASLFEPVYRL